MPLIVYNTLSRRKEEFKPLVGNRVKMFVCGPTVYDLSHIGHARTYVAYDIIAKYLRYRGYSVFFIMNITDVDDKIINRAKEKGVDPLSLAEEYTEEFYSDMEALGIDSINLYAKASEHIPEMISQISTLIEKGYAYTVDGDVYYDTSKFLDYGKLSHQKPEELKKHRIEPDPRKKSPNDFSLWKSQKIDEIAWDSPWGKGRPGWHIEDTAIALTYFGEKYDIHGGAIELIFPHHEAEIAQAEAITDKKPFVNYWIHTGILYVKGKKMSKSLGNFITIKDALKKYSPELIKTFFALSHYRSPIDYDEEKISHAEKILRQIYEAYELAKSSFKKAKDGEGPLDQELLNLLGKHVERFFEAMDDDFNTPKALSSLLGLSKEIKRFNPENLSKDVLNKTIATFKELGSIIGILKEERRAEEKVLEELIEIIVEARDYLKNKKDWRISDKIRERLRKVGIVLEDTPEKTVWKWKVS
ncbi:MAG: cysteine--tRNA ligase [Candidatus Bathyarchaeia archaeon]